MLTELRIQNFAIIDDLQLRFDDGLVIFTGETGAGKSIIIDAVETLLGVRADTTVIRTGVEFASVEGSFRIGPAVREPVHAILDREALLDDQEYVTLAREFRRQGRNVARVNGRVVNLALLKDLGELLIDLHGQSEHLSLLRVESHLGLLDRFAEVEKQLDDYRQSYKELQALRGELSELRKAEADAKRRQELLSFQVEEISTAALEANEENELKEERSRLANAESLANHANQALEAIDETEMDTPSATDRMGVAVEALEGLVRLDESQGELSQRAQEVFANVSDLALELRKYLEVIEFNPARLEEVEERLNLISQLKRKYGESIAAVLAFGEQAQNDLDAISHAEERMAELQFNEGVLLKVVAEKALVLSAKRHAAAEQLSQSIVTQLDDLRMSEAQFGVDFQTKTDQQGLDIGADEAVAFDSRGFESVEFMVAPNPGEGLKPLVKIASGGETARLMLALKNVLASADHTPTLIFDEIDQGIGGRVGAIVGQKLWNLARNHQVLCITHLPQLAGYGEQHYKVDKLVEKGRTTTQVIPMVGEERLMELAQMLGEVSEGTLQSAHEILQSVGKATAA